METTIKVLVLESIRTYQKLEVYSTQALTLDGTISSNAGTYTYYKSSKNMG